jgi:hypothetical protein
MLSEDNVMIRNTAAMKPRRAVYENKKIHLAGFEKIES